MLSWTEARLVLIPLRTLSIFDKDFLYGFMQVLWLRLCRNDIQNPEGHGLQSEAPDFETWCCGCRISRCLAEQPVREADFSSSVLGSLLSQETAAKAISTLFRQPYGL